MTAATLDVQVNIDGAPGPRFSISLEQLVRSGATATSVDLSRSSVGRHRIEAAVRIGGQELGVLRTSTFLSESARTRLEIAKAAFSQALSRSEPLSRRGLAAATGMERLLLVEQALDGVDSPIEIDPPRILEEMESWIRALNEGSDPLAGISGDQLIAVADAGGNRLPFRMYVPPDPERASGVPLVVALHGMGGDENIFFEACGDGAAVAEASRRGFALVAPRAPGLFAFSGDHAVRALEAARLLVKIDPNRVFLFGHSMGAGQSVQLALTRPGLFTAIALIAGGWSSGRQVQGLARQPILLICGEKDRIAVSMCRQLASAARAAHLPRFEYRELPQTEHLLIVGDCMPAVFDFFVTSPVAAGSESATAGDR